MVSFDEFCKYLKLVIEDENENINELEKNKLIDNYINLLNEDKDEINSDSISVIIIKFLIHQMKKII